ncbi:TPA: restriction endonuclease subunit S [Aeromonas hydrophila]
MSSINSCNWIELKIGEVAEVVAGGTPRASNPDNFKAPGTGIAWLTPADLSGYTRKHISFGARDLSNQGYNSCSAKILPKGSLLFSSRAPIGYVAIAQNDISTNQGFKNFVFTYGVDSDYAYYYLRCIRDLAESLGTGTTFKEISVATAKNLPFLLAPLAEQKKISDKLDALLAQVETIKMRLEKIPEIIESFRQSVLTTAISGKLTEDWRIMSGSNQKITRSQILEARKLAWENAEFEKLVGSDKPPKNEKWKKKYKSPEGVIDENCFDIPDSWEWSNLGELAWSIKDGPHYSPKYSDSGVPFISGGNISPEGINFSNCKYISYELHEDLSKRCKPEIGDVLYTKGGTTGIAYFNTEERDFNVWVHVAVLKITPVIDGHYLQRALNSKHCYDQSQSYTRGVGNQDLGLTRMVKITIPVPPIDEQNEIACRVEELFTFAGLIEQKANAALARVNNLTQSILAKAFRGELTADWRADNPDLITGDNSAMALYKKIKVKREAIEKKPKSTRSAIKMKTGDHMSKQIIKVVDTLKRAGKPLSGQQLLAAAGYPSDSSTEQLEQFFLDIREALTIEESIVKLERSDDSQDWFALAKPPMNKVTIKN